MQNINDASIILNQNHDYTKQAGILKSKRLFVNNLRLSNLLSLFYAEFSVKFLACFLARWFLKGRCEF